MHVTLGCLDIGALIDPRSCPFLTPAKLVIMLNYISEKHIFVYMEFDQIAADHGGIAGICSLTRY